MTLFPKVSSSNHLNDIISVIMKTILHTILWICEVDKYLYTNSFITVMWAKINDNTCMLTTLMQLFTIEVLKEKEEDN